VKSWAPAPLYKEFRAVLADLELLDNSAAEGPLSSVSAPLT